MESVEHRSQARSWYRQNASVAQWQIERQILVGRVRDRANAEGRARDRREDGRHQINSLAIDQRAKVELEPVDAGAFVKLRRNLAVRLNKADRKIGGDLDLPNGRAKRRHIVLEYVNPSDPVLVIRKDKIIAKYHRNPVWVLFEQLLEAEGADASNSLMLGDAVAYHFDDAPIPREYWEVARVMCTDVHPRIAVAESRNRHPRG
jgi:hypothetical protein